MLENIKLRGTTSRILTLPFTPEDEACDPGLIGAPSCHRVLAFGKAVFFQCHL